MDEFGLIQRYFRVEPEPGARLPVLGIGDDAALIAAGVGEHWAVAADTLVEGVHFPQASEPARVAARALRVNLSDMAAMGAEPCFFTLCLTLPEANEAWLADFSSGLHYQAKLFNCSLIGGDTTSGPLCISIQMLGRLPAGTAIRRSGAAVGDLILVTGQLGDAAGFVRRGLQGEDELSQRFWYPQPRIEFALDARTLVSAAIDVSDGLVADLGHIVKASGVGAEIELGTLPISNLLRQTFPEDAISLAATGGDDYELCLTCPRDCLQPLQNLAARHNLQLTRIGEITAGEGVTCRDSKGRVVSFASGGYRHF